MRKELAAALAGQPPHGAAKVPRAIGDRLLAEGRSRVTDLLPKQPSPRVERS